MTNFWGTKETLNWTVDNLIQGEKMDSFGDCKEADITELFKRCFDLADQLFDQAPESDQTAGQPNQNRV